MNLFSKVFNYYLCKVYNNYNMLLHNALTMFKKDSTPW